MPEDRLIEFSPDQLIQIGIAKRGRLSCEFPDADSAEAKMQPEPARAGDGGIIPLLVVFFSRSLCMAGGGKDSPLAANPIAARAGIGPGSC
jgi:hypothetical protein